MHDGAMRTTVTLQDDTHKFATYYAQARGLTLSAAIEELIRKAQQAPLSPPDMWHSPNGLPMFPPTRRTITSEMVKKLSEDEIE